MSNSSLVVIGADLADTLVFLAQRSTANSVHVQKRKGAAVYQTMSLLFSAGRFLSGRGNKTGIDRDGPCMTSHRFSVIRMTLTQSARRAVRRKMIPPEP